MNRHTRDSADPPERARLAGPWLATVVHQWHQRPQQGRVDGASRLDKVLAAAVAPGRRLGGPRVTSRPVGAADELRASLSDVAHALYTLDASPDMVFVRGQADAGNQAAAAAVRSIGLAWERYPLAKEAVDLLEAALAGRDEAAVEHLLGRQAVILPDGSPIGIAALIQDVQIRVDDVGGRVAALAGAARRALATLDAVRTAAQDVFVRAGAMGADGDHEFRSLRAAIDAAANTIAADPTRAGDLGDAERLLEAARDRVEHLERSRREVPAALAEAARLLDDLELAARRGAEDYERARTKIASPGGLTRPVTVATQGDRAPRPWLDRIRALADAGEWDEAAAGLAAWRTAADGLLAEARRVAAANAAPLERRNELRGLLDAYRAKAAAIGRDEDGELARRHAAAKALLYTAPCPLDEAERLVREYVGAVNGAQRKE